MIKIIWFELSWICVIYLLIWPD